MLPLTVVSHYWDAETGENGAFSGKGHSNLVSRMAVDESNQLVSCGMDDTVRFTSVTKKEYSASDLVKMDVQPKCIAVGPGGYAVAVCIGQLVLLKDKKKGFGMDNLGYEPEAAAVHPGGVTVAVGGSDGKVHLYSIQGNTLKDDGKTLEVKGPVTDLAYSHDGAHLAVCDGNKAVTVFTVADGYADGKVHLYSIQGNTLKDDGKTLEVKGPVTDLAYSHDGAHLAVCDANKAVTVFTVADGYAEKGVFYGHHAKVVCIAWSPDNEHFATGGMDMMVSVWTVSNSDTRIKMPDAHRMHHVSSVAWLDEHTLITTSHDSSVKQWTVTYK
ncbi:UNVERIFIED_CONTAM: hypothetical protein FKN15_044300 [Acipenser sinensis]